MKGVGWSATVLLTSYYRKRCSKRTNALGKVSEHQMFSSEKLELRVFTNYNFAFVKHHQEIHLLPSSKIQPPNRLRLQDWDNDRVIKFYVIKSETGGLSSAYRLHLYIDTCSFISSYVTSKVILRFFYLHSYRTLVQYLPHTIFYSYTTYEGALVTYNIYD